MANEQQQEREDATQKEEVRPVIPTTSDTNIFTNDADSEFAADTWTGAVFDPEATLPQGNQEVTSRDRTGQAGESGDAESPQTASGVATTEQQEAKQAARSDRVPDTAAERANLGLIDSEAASEIAPPVGNEGKVTADPERKGQREAATQTADMAVGMGWIGLGVSILSLFFLPYLLGPVGIVLGYLAFRREARTLGTWAMLVGALGILGSLVLYPFLTPR